MKSNERICVDCGTVGSPKSGMQGSLLVEVVLWCLMILPGLIYSIWRFTTKAARCASCGSKNLIKTDSPRGRVLLQQFGGAGKIIAAILVLAFTSCASFAQSGTVEMQCRHLAGGGADFLQSNETYVNGMACHPVETKPATVTIVEAKKPEPKPVVESSPAVAPEPNTVFIAPMSGFETYLSAAFAKKQVPLTVVADEARAAFLIRGTAAEQKAGWAKMAFTGSIHSDDEASIQMIDRKTDAVVFAYAVNKKNTWHGQQTTAEACAKHLAEQLEKKK